MNPDFKIKEPSVGDRITAKQTADMVKAIKALQPSVGFGLKISRNNLGTIYSLDESIIQKNTNKPMPFDATYMLSAEGSETGSAFRIQKGNLYITYDHHTALINPEEERQVYDYPYEFDTENEGKWALCLSCKYEDGGEYDTVNTVLPINWGFNVIEISQGLSALTEIARLKYYPIAIIESHLTETLPDDWSQGPVKQTWVKQEKSFRMTQVHHGDAWWEDTSGRQAVVAEIQQSGIGQHGSMYGQIIDDTGQYPEQGINIDAVELAGGTYYPSGARVIAHPIRVKILGGGFTE